MNGIAVHGGLIPYGGTFLVFSDYARGAIRLSALMGARVVYVMTHDSIGLGEDGPTHQPIEHLISLRAIPGLLVLRPADAVETAESLGGRADRRWPVAAGAVAAEPADDAHHAHDGEHQRARRLRDRGGVRQAGADDPRHRLRGAACRRGAREAGGRGRADGGRVAAELGAVREAGHRRTAPQVLGTAPRIAVEAASPLGWTRYVDSEDDVLAMRGFGASAPAKDLNELFGFTPDSLVRLARTKLAQTARHGGNAGGSRRV